MDLTSKIAPEQIQYPWSDYVSFSFLKKSYRVRTIYLLIIILLLGTVLRIYKLDFQSLWYDEIHSMNGADPDATISQVIEYSKTDQPPFFFLALHFWFNLFPFNDFYGRLFIAIVGIFGILAMYVLGKEVKDHQTGLIASLLTAVNYFHIAYSQEVRFYSMLFLVSALSFLFFMRGVRHIKVVDFALYVFFTTLAVYTHYYGLVIVAAQAIIFISIQFIYGYNKKLLIYGVAAAFAILIFILPWTPQFLKDSQIDGFWIKPEKFPEFLFAYFYDYFKDNVLFYSFGILASYYLVNVLFMAWKKKEGIPVQIFIVLVSVVLCYGIPYVYSILKAPMLVVRYTIIALPVVLLTLALSIRALKKKWVSYAAIVLALLSIRTLFFIQDYYIKIKKEQWREVTQQVIKEDKESCLMFSYYAWHYNYYFKSLHSTYRVTHPSSVNYEESLKKVNCVWLLQGHEDNIGASREEVNLIEKDFYLSKEFKFIGARGTLYERRK